MAESIDPQNDPKQLVQKGYDEIAQRYLDWSIETPSPRNQYLNKLISLLPPKASVLELGCGAGITGTQLLVAQSFKVTANDISASQIELARKNVPEATLVQGDMTTLDFSPGAFHAVAAFYSIIHLPREEQEDMLERILKWLDDGGYLVTNLGTKDDPGHFAEDWLGSRMYWSGYDADEYRKMFERVGFELVEAKVVESEEHGVMVPFLWVVARKREYPGTKP